LNSDVRGTGGETPSETWRRGYYLSTSIEGAHSRNRNAKAPLEKHMTADNVLNVNSPKSIIPNNELKPKDYIDYEIPDNMKEQNVMIPERDWGGAKGSNDTAGYNFCESGNDQETMGHTINPCPKHYNKEIEYIDKTEKKGLCRDCLLPAQDLNHEVLTMQDVKDNVNVCLMQLESSAMKMLTQK
jgi:hypothetical protein